MELKRLSLGLFLGLSFFLNNALFAAASAKANNPAKPNMNSITHNVDGPTVQTPSDGTKIIQKNADGSEIDSKFN